MNANTLLALMAKARRVFETEDTFLSFPLLYPLAFTPEYLAGLSGTRLNMAALCEFSRLVNVSPGGMIYRGAQEPFLWEIYGDALYSMKVASGVLSAAEAEALAAARQVLYVPLEGGLRGDSEKLRAYRAYRDAWIAATEEYKNAQISAESLSGDAPETQAARDHWTQVEEPALRSQVALAASDWESRGYRAEVENAQRTEREMAARQPGRLSDEWKQQFNPDLDVMHEPGTQAEFAPCGLSPSNALEAPWPSFTLSAPEVEALLRDAPSELSQVLDLDGAGQVLDKLAFEFRSVGVTRAWFSKDFFASRFWNLPDGGQPLSDGATPASGSFTSCVVGIVLARNIVEWFRPDAGAGPTPRPIRVFPAVQVRQALLQDLISRGDRPDLASKAALGLDLRQLKAASLAPAASPRDDALRKAALQPAALRDAADPALADQGRPLLRLNASAFKLAPVDRMRDATLLTRPLGPFRPAGPPVAAPAPAPAPAPSPAEPPSTAVTFLAFICKRVPKCPDPDPGLAWG